MNDSEWLECEDPSRMLGYICGRVSARKQRLFAVACCREIWPLLVAEESRKAVIVAERFADGLATRTELIEARKEAYKIADAYWDWSTDYPDSFDLPDASYSGGDITATLAAFAATGHAENVAAERTNDFFFADGVHSLAAHSAVTVVGDGGASYCTTREPPGPGPMRVTQSHLLRDIVRNPSRPAEFDPDWLKPIVVSMANTIYDDRAYDDMPILADALEDVGCTDQEILEHCRSEGPHVRGCWVLDLLTGRE